MKPTGKMTVVVPLGVLFRAGAEGRIRAGMLAADVVEAVIALGPNLFYGTTIPAAVTAVGWLQEGATTVRGDHVAPPSVEVLLQMSRRGGFGFGSGW